jgi:two-component system chemotaxis response regulator CheB
MTSRRVVVIGGSAGAVEALKVMVAGLPADFQAPVCVVVHTAPDSPGILGKILDRAGALAAVTAAGGERLEAGKIYVAAPDVHLLIEPGLLKVSKGPRENRFRPAIDPLFRSAAQIFGPAAIGVILTGHLDDGAAGLWAIDRLGGVTIVQDPDDAMFGAMPSNALKHVRPTHVVPLCGIAPLLVELMSSPVQEAVRGPVPNLEVEVKIADAHNAIDAGVEQLGDPSPFSCPECHGVLLHVKNTNPLRFRCYTGHAYSVASLVAAVDDDVEASGWTAVRSLEQGAMLLRHLTTVHAGQLEADDARRLAQHAAETHGQAEKIRSVLAARQRLTSAKTA